MSEHNQSDLHARFCVPLGYSERTHTWWQEYVAAKPSICMRLAAPHTWIIIQHHPDVPFHHVCGKCGGPTCMSGGSDSCFDWCRDCRGMSTPPWHIGSVEDLPKESEPLPPNVIARKWP